MKQLIKPRLLPLLSLAAGISGLLLQWLLFLLTLDGRGLVAEPHMLHILALLIQGAAIAAFIIGVLPLQGHNRYADNYPASVTGGIGSFALAAGILLTVPSRLSIRGNGLVLLWMVLGGLTVPCLIFTGVCRLRGKRPAFLFHSVTCLFFAVQLVLSCQSWSKEPQISTYIFSLLGCIALMLNAYYRAAFDSGIGRRRMQLFTGLAAGSLCLAALPGSDCPLLLLTGSLWTLTNLCVPEPPRRRRQVEASPEAPVPTEEA